MDRIGVLLDDSTSSKVVELAEVYGYDIFDTIAEAVDRMHQDYLFMVAEEANERRR